MNAMWGCRWKWDGNDSEFRIQRNLYWRQPAGTKIELLLIDGVPISSHAQFKVLGFFDLLYVVWDQSIWLEHHVLLWRVFFATCLARRLGWWARGGDLMIQGGLMPSSTWNLVTALHNNTKFLSCVSDLQAHTNINSKFCSFLTFTLESSCKGYPVNKTCYLKSGSSFYKV